MMTAAMVILNEYGDTSSLYKIKINTSTQQLRKYIEFNLPSAIVIGSS